MPLARTSCTGVPPRGSPHPSSPSPGVSVTVHDMQCQEVHRNLLCVPGESPSTRHHRHPAAWSTFLPLVEYAQNSLVASATGVSPFMVATGFQPPLFGQEEEAAVSSVRAHLRRCHRVWHQVRASLRHSSLCSQTQANRRQTPAPRYRPGQRVWLSARELPLQVECRKLAPWFLGPFEVDRMINPTAVQLRLPAAMRVHPTFHISRVRSVVESSLCPEEWSWIPHRHILDRSMQQTFYQDYPDMPVRAPRGGGIVGSRLFLRRCWAASSPLDGAK